MALTGHLFCLETRAFKAAKSLFYVKTTAFSAGTSTLQSSFSFENCLHRSKISENNSSGGCRTSSQNFKIFPVVTLLSEMRYCDHCKKTYTDENNFCGICGKRLPNYNSECPTVLSFLCLPVHA